MQNNMIDVSIVIVCMDNLKNLCPCLNSIRKFTHRVTYETLVVAYLFSKENLEKLKSDFPWVIIIESNEIRGFSENNNLALKQAKGKYCFVLNDDTEMKMPVIDELVETIEGLPKDVAVVSPKSVYGDESFQSCGRDIHSTWKFFLSCFHLYNERQYLKKYEFAQGTFETGDIVGAFFLIKTAIFKKIGFFDERYFFCPEDIAIGYELRKHGYKHYVNEDIEIIHYEGMSGGKSMSRTRCATAPASTKGQLIFYSHGNVIIYLLLALSKVFTLIPSMCFHIVESIYYEKPNPFQILALSDWNSIKACFSHKTPKQNFKKYYL